MLYGLGPATILTLILIHKVKICWSSAMALATQDPELSLIVEKAFSKYVDAWFRAISRACFIVLPTAAFVLLFNGDSSEKVAFLSILTYLFPGLLYAITLSWTQYFRDGVENSLFLFHGKAPVSPIIGYLRGRQEMRRTMVVQGPDGAFREVQNHKGIENLAEVVPRDRIFAFWDLSDERSVGDCSPLLSVDEEWKDSIRKLCELSNLIVLDVSIFTPSVEWEGQLILSSSNLQRKTLLLRSESDDALPPSIVDLAERVRWVVTFRERSDLDPIVFPSDFLKIANGPGLG